MMKTLTIFNIFPLMLFQECYLALARHQNVHLLQVERLVRCGGPWACPTLQAILSGPSLPQGEGMQHGQHLSLLLHLLH